MPAATSTPAVGHVKWFNVKKGYGFITLADKSDDIFAHRNNIKNSNRQHAVPSLGDGELVEFDIVTTDNGPEAVNISGPKGTRVEGSIHAWSRKCRSAATTSTTHGPQSGDTSHSIIDVVIRTAMALAGGDFHHLRRLLPALLKENNLPVIQLPPHLPHTAPPPRRKKPAAKTQQPQLPTQPEDVSAPLPSSPALSSPKAFSLPPPERPATPSDDEEEEEDVEDEEDDSSPPSPSPTPSPSPPPSPSPSPSQSPPPPTPPPAKETYEEWFDRKIIPKFHDPYQVTFSKKYSSFVPKKHWWRYITWCDTRPCPCATHRLARGKWVTELLDEDDEAKQLLNLMTEMKKILK